MNPIAKILPILGQSKRLRPWIAVLVAVVTAYQLFSTNGVGAKWGIPSYDTFYAEPRDVLISRVEAARDEQQQTAEEFTTALEQFKQITSFDGGDLEDKFNQLNNAYEESESAADAVSHRIDLVVRASNRLLSEWKEELDEYHDAAIKRRASVQFDRTRTNAQELIKLMRSAEESTKPVLAAFKDQVLFIKHNLNMQAISSLQQESQSIEEDVDELILQMQQSIAEAERFISDLESDLS